MIRARRPRIGTHPSVIIRSWLELGSDRRACGPEKFGTIERVEFFNGILEIRTARANDTSVRPARYWMSCGRQPRIGLMPIGGPELTKKETCGSQQSGPPQRLRPGEDRNLAAHHAATQSGLLAEHRAQPAGRRPSPPPARRLAHPTQGRR
jgi:hypothetical protein